MNRKRSGHSRLDDQAILVQLENRVLGAPENSPDFRAGQSPDETAAGDSTKDIVVAQGGPTDGTSNQGWADVSNDGFDLGQLGHRPRIRRSPCRAWCGE
jgi:hypothetical protein